MKFLVEGFLFVFLFFDLFGFIFFMIDRFFVFLFNFVIKRKFMVFFDIIELFLVMFKGMILR